MASILDFFFAVNLLPSVLSGVMPYSQNSLDSENSEAFAERTFFYVGGQYVNITFVSPLPSRRSPVSAADTISQPGAQEDQYMVGQIYVERLTPPTVLHEHPLVFIHGSGQTATVRTPYGHAFSGSLEA